MFLEFEKKKGPKSKMDTKLLFEKGLSKTLVREKNIMKVTYFKFEL